MQIYNLFVCAGKKMISVGRCNWKKGEKTNNGYIKNEMNRSGGCLVKLCVTWNERIGEKWKRYYTRKKPKSGKEGTKNQTKENSLNHEKERE